MPHIIILGLVDDDRPHIVRFCCLMLRLRTVIILLVFFLVACETAERTSSGSWPRSRAQVGGNLGVRIDLLEGTAVPMAKLLASSVAENLEKRDIPATAQTEKRSRYVLKRSC